MKFLKKNLFSNLSKYFFLILVIFVVFLLQQRHQTTKFNRFYAQIFEEDKKWMNEFFSDLFLEEPAIYTLFGTKPMSGITIAIPIETEYIQAYQAQLQDLSEERKEKALAAIKKYCNEYDLHINWERWVAWKKKYPSFSFLFAKRSTDQSNVFNIEIINVKEALKILQKHYLLFKHELKMDFNPLQVIQDFENPQSVFWEKVFSCHLLQGILYGYGEKNANLFSQEMEFKEITNLNRDTDFSFAEDSEPIPLPTFKSYTLGDPILLKYKQERIKIQTYLKGKDFQKEVLKKLINSHC